MEDEDSTDEDWTPLVGRSDRCFSNGGISMSAYFSFMLISIRTVRLLGGEDVGKRELIFFVRGLPSLGYQTDFMSFCTTDSAESRPMANGGEDCAFVSKETVIISLPLTSTS